jgi:hypothetical protein
MIEAAPLFPPLHKILVIKLTDEVIAGGCVMITFWITLQLLASLMVQEYEPAARLIMVAAVPPPGVQE